MEKNNVFHTMPEFTLSLETTPCVHFIGIGGIGMSALAQLLAAQGFTVRGSDVAASALIEKLRAQDITVMIGHNAAHVTGARLVVYSTCIKEDNPELSAARAMGIPCITRGQLLAEVSQRFTLFAVTGAHGKTTTTAMLARVCIDAGSDPTVLLGGETDFLDDGNARQGQGLSLITEADESDGSFLFLHPDYALISNIDIEHLEYYRDMGHIIASYQQFVDQIKPGGWLITSYDNAKAREVFEAYSGNKVSFGFAEEANVRAANCEVDGLTTRFDCWYGPDLLGRVTLAVPGEHNVLNALSVIALARIMGIPFDSIRASLAAFNGTRRRFDIRSTRDDIVVVEDYAHHPTEITATLASIKQWASGRTICVFQPHRYTRTKFLGELFGGCFDKSDYLILTDIYAASEPAIDGIDGEYLLNIVQRAGHSNARYMEKGVIVHHVREIARPGDVVAVLGAGDIGDVAQELAE